eukprot:m.355249 g.355249  ORF g.355249 m.355249 type:complete len:88 (+) comp17206_c0_seq1:487-750(+)
MRLGFCVLDKLVSGFACRVVSLGMVVSLVPPTSFACVFVGLFSGTFKLFRRVVQPLEATILSKCRLLYPKRIQTHECLRILAPLNRS